MTIERRLKEERERLGFSQPKFGELTGVVKQTVIQWEKGTSAPNAGQLSAFAAAGADVLYILTGQRSGSAPASADNAARNAAELEYLHNCRLLSTRGLEGQGLKGLEFLRESIGIKSADLPAYRPSGMTTRLEVRGSDSRARDEFDATLAKRYHACSKETKQIIESALNADEKRRAAKHARKAA